MAAGILFFPALWFAFALGVWGLLNSLDATNPVPGWPFLLAGVAAGLVTWVIVRRSSAPVAGTLSVLALLALGWIGSVIQRVANTMQPIQ
jgi:hypothetical protein